MIKDLNKRFRKKNKTTDIISFPFHEKKELNRLLKSNQKVYIGDIVINLNKVKKDNFKKILIFYGFMDYCISLDSRTVKILNIIKC